MGGRTIFQANKIMIVRQAANALEILEYFARRLRPATAAEIAEDLGWPRSSTFKLVATLASKGYLYEPRGRGGYYPSPRWLVLGDMGEVGQEGPQFHREIGAYAKTSGIARLFAAGDLARDAVAAFGEGGEHFASVEALAARLAGESRAGVTMLVKGSRFMRMERVVAALTGTAGGTAH